MPDNQLVPVLAQTGENGPCSLSSTTNLFLPGSARQQPSVSLPVPAARFSSFAPAELSQIVSLDLKREISLVSLREMLKREPLRAQVIFEDCFRLYEQSFPDTNEISSAEEIVKAMRDESLHFDVVAMIESGRVLGARQLILLESGIPEIGPFVVGEHMYVDRTERKRGLGSALVARTEELMRSWGVRIAISEQNDPDAMSPELLALDESSGISAAQRRTFWKKQGYEGIDAPYVMPPISDEKEAVYHLRVAIRRLDPTFPDTVETGSFIAMLRAYHASWVEDVDTNPHTNALYERLRLEYPQCVQIIDLEARRSCLS